MFGGRAGVLEISNIGQIGFSFVGGSVCSGIDVPNKSEKFSGLRRGGEAIGLDVF